MRRGKTVRQNRKVRHDRQISSSTAAMQELHMRPQYDNAAVLPIQRRTAAHSSVNSIALLKLDRASTPSIHHLNCSAEQLHP